jgi:hypothetical protein
VWLTDGCISALYRFSPKTLALEVFSYRTILPGEEITVSCKSMSSEICCQRGVD